jgi:hypothetical protein
MAKPPSALSQELLSKIAEAIQGIRFGTVQITIHDSRVVQIEKAEKIRLDQGADLPAPRPAQQTCLAEAPINTVRQAGLIAGGASNTIERTDRTTGGSQTADGR